MSSNKQWHRVFIVAKLLYSYSFVDFQSFLRNTSYRTSRIDIHEPQPAYKMKAAVESSVIDFSRRVNSQ